MIIKRLGKDALVYGGGDFFLKLLGFLVFPVYAHLFSVTDFGVIALIAASTGLVGVVINLGVNNAIQRFYWDPGTPEGARPILLATGLAQLVISGIVVIALLLACLYPQNLAIAKQYGISWEVLVLAICTILPDQVLQYVLDAIRLQFAPLKFLAISFCKNILGIILGLILVIQLQAGLFGMFLGAFLASSLSIPIGLWLIRGNLSSRCNLKTAAKLFKFGYPFVFAGIAYWVSSAMDRWMLAQLSQPEQVGLYGIAFKFAAIVTFVTGAFGQAWSPFAIRVLRDDPAYRKTYSRIFSIWFFLLAFMALAISLFAGELLIVFTPSPYWASAPILVLVTVGTAIFGTTQVTALGISIEKKTGLLTFGAILSGIVNFSMNFILIPRFGAEGAATATLASYAVLTIFYLYWTQRLHPLPLETLKLLYSIGVFLLALLTLLLIPKGDWLGWVVIGKMGCLLLVIAGAAGARIVDRTFVTSFFTSRV